MAEKSGHTLKSCCLPNLRIASLSSTVPAFMPDSGIPSFVKARSSADKSAVFSIVKADPVSRGTQMG